MAEQATSLAVQADGYQQHLANQFYDTIIVGSGPVGFKAAQQLTKSLSETQGSNAPAHKVLLIGNEPFEPYDRVRLSSVLAGQSNAEQLFYAASPSASEQLAYTCAHIVKIHRDTRMVEDRDGHHYHYKNLILATGSKPAIPSVPGMNLPGVYAFRNLSDINHLLARRVRSRHTVVLGGGLLGVEAARGMCRLGTRVTLIEHNTHLLFNQLDHTAAKLLEDRLTDQDVTVLTQSRVRMALGTTSLSGVVLADNSELACDTLILATGIRPNIELAREAGLAIGKGISVDRQMQTSDPDIYAIGECSELDGQVHGTVAPGYEQAKIVASVIQGDASQFIPSTLSTSLKVVDESVVSIGEANDSPTGIRAITYSADGIYRRINTRHGRVVGALAIGDWPDQIRLKTLIAKRGWLTPWQRLRFKLDGSLWAPSAQDAASLPDSAIICTCNGVSKGEICQSVTNGATLPALITEQTGAGSTCGTCKPLLQELSGSSDRQPVPWAQGLAAFCALSALMVAAALFAPALPYAISAANSWHWDVLWTTSLYKQASGFTVLGLAAIAAFLSLRKRTPKVNFGKYDTWRFIHLGIGALCLIGLFAHTGFRLGHNLNFYLMTTFVILSLAGVVLGGAIALEHRLAPATVATLRRFGLLTHIFLLWPIPVLLTFHVLKTYYF